jgi:aminomethyltransferase
MDSTAQRSPLHDRHIALGAKFAPFGGWTMPLEYAGGGVLREHAAVREAVGLFDVSHLGTVTVTGPDAVGFLNARLTNDLARIGAGQAQYTLCCAENGGVVDDIFVYRFADDHVLLIPNAANAAQVVRRLRAEAPATITIDDQHEAYAILAVQGPHSADLVTALDLPARHPYLSFRTAEFGGAPVVVCRTGYTGEHGYELVVPAEHAGAVWDALLRTGEPYGLRPAGLAARDTLRTEMGYPLHGQDLSVEITPVQAGLNWAVGWDKPAFWGRDALLAEKAAGPRRRLWGLRALDRGIPRPHMPVLAADADTVIGEVTSGTFSPTLKTGIAHPLLDTAAGLGPESKVAVDVRGRRTQMEVVRPPFVRPSVRT